MLKSWDISALMRNTIEDSASLDSSSPRIQQSTLKARPGNLSIPTIASVEGSTDDATLLPCKLLHPFPLGVLKDVDTTVSTNDREPTIRSNLNNLKITSQTKSIHISPDTALPKSESLLHLRFEDSIDMSHSGDIKSSSPYISVTSIPSVALSKDVSGFNELKSFLCIPNQYLSNNFDKSKNTDWVMQHSTSIWEAILSETSNKINDNDLVIIKTQDVPEEGSSSKPLILCDTLLSLSGNSFCASASVHDSSMASDNGNGSSTDNGDILPTTMLWIFICDDASSILSMSPKTKVFTGVTAEEVNTFI